MNRYDPEYGGKSGDYLGTMAPSKDGDYVLYTDHCEVVRELVEALQRILPLEASPYVKEIARAVIAKHHELKE